MTTINEFNWSEILDRSDLEYSVYIAALDIQYSHDIPYLWAFKLDSVDQIVIGRSWEELREFFRILSQRMHTHINLTMPPRDSNGRYVGKEHYSGHILKVIVEDMPRFFQYAKKELPFLPLPFVAKSEGEVLLATLDNGIQFQGFTHYSENKLDDEMLKAEGIVSPDIEHEKLSSKCKLTDQELDYVSSRVYYLTAYFRNELNLSYQGDAKLLPLTLTRRVSRLFSREMRKHTNRAAANITTQIKNMNPLSSEYGRECILTYLRKAFSGGVAFYEEDVIGREFSDAWCADLSSAYIARMILSRYPMSAFKPLEPPDNWEELTTDSYRNFAYLVTFEIPEIELKPGGFPFLSANGRFQYKDFDNEKEAKAHYEGEILCSSTRIKAAKYFRATLTDIDFKLLCQNYNFDHSKLRLLDLVAARYGYLPDYILNVIVQLYSGKAKAKEIKEALQALGELSEREKYEYERAKSMPARVYGIFTQSPIVTRYAFNPETGDPEIIDNNYISDRSEFKPVVYQWGVWTTALVRKEIAALRAALMRAPEELQVRVISGDTDCVNGVGDSDPIIAQYNKKINRQIAARAKALGIDPDLLKDLGSLTIEKYKRYKVTGLKQYAYIRESEKGLQFGYKVGGMNPNCDYFDKHFRDPNKKFEHFGVGLVIPREYEPRHYTLYINEPKVVRWKDRDGNIISDTVKTYCEVCKERFVIHSCFDLEKLNNDPVNFKPKRTRKNALKLLADKIGAFDFQNTNYFKRGNK